TLKIVEPAHLLLGRVRDETRREDAPEVRVLLRPADADHAPVGLLLCPLVRRPRHRLAAPRAVEDQTADPLPTRDRVGHGDSRAAGHPEQREALQPRRGEDRLEIANARLQGEVVDGPIGHAETPLVVSYHGGDLAELVEEVPPDRTLPIVLEMAQPTRDDDQWRPAAVDRVRQTQPAASAAEP